MYENTAKLIQDLGAFSDILYGILEAAEIKPAQFVEKPEIKKLGMTRQRMSDIKNKIYTPKFEVAKKMLEALNCTMSDEELLKSLKMNRILVKEIAAQREKYLSKTIYLRYQRMMKKNSDVVKQQHLLEAIDYSTYLYADREEFDDSEIKCIMEDRIKSLYGNSNEFTRYVEDLIGMDLRFNMLAMTIIRDK